MEFTIKIPSGPDERWDVNAFDNIVGSEILISIPDGKSTFGTLINAVVDSDGRTVELTIQHRNLTPDVSVGSFIPWRKGY